jgi:hypothetical protein
MWVMADRRSPAPSPRAQGQEQIVHLQPRAGLLEGIVPGQIHAPERGLELPPAGLKIVAPANAKNSEFGTDDGCGARRGDGRRDQRLGERALVVVLQDQRVGVTSAACRRDERS